MKYIDLHCDTLLRCYFEGAALGKNNIHLDLTRSKKAGLMAQCTAVYIPTHDMAELCNLKKSPDDYFLDCVEMYRRELDINKDLAAQALTSEDIANNFADGKISTILTIENGVIVWDKLENLTKFFELGVRLITLTWNYENCFGFPQSTDADIMKRGLKPFGIEAIKHMNELGIIVDVSHLSEGGFYDVAKHSRKPFVASHSCCRSLCDVGRNLTDDQLRLLGDRGGVCGINFAPRFIEKDSEYARTEDIVRHMRHIADKAGIGAVAFGSDFDGFTGDLEFGDCTGMPTLIDALSKVFSQRELEMICYGNALRLFKDNF